ncbi:MAG: hypothetical protein AAF533_00955 [Acidobacteriota bacterium]
MTRDEGADTRLDTLGRFLMKHLRDAAFRGHEQVATGQARAPGLQGLVTDLRAMTPEQQEVVRRAVRHAVDAGLHDFLFALQESLDLEGGEVALTVGGTNAAELEAEGLHGELFTQEGWRARFSELGEPEGDA